MADDLATIAAARAKEAMEARFKTRLASAEQRNGYEVGWFEGYMAGRDPIELLATIVADLEAMPGHLRLQVALSTPGRRMREILEGFIERETDDATP